MRDPRSWVLIALAVVCASRAWAYAAPSGEPLPVGLSTVADVINVRWYALLWGLNAIALAVVAVRRSPASTRNAWVVLAPTFWGCLYFAGGVGGEQKGFSSAVLFWGLAVIIGGTMLGWPRPRRVRS